jgi:hypothetical protein
MRFQPTQKAVRLKRWLLKTKKKDADMPKIYVYLGIVIL